MKDFLKRIRADYILSSLLTIALGVVFIIWKETVLSVMGSMFAIILIAIGIVYLCCFFMNILSSKFSMVMAVIVLAVGIWFLIQPDIIIKLIPILIGVVLGFHGIRGVVESIYAKNYGSGRWMAGLIMGAISIVIGIICITNAFGIMENAIVVVGIFLIYNGISNILIALGTGRAERKYNKNQTIDVEFVEDQTIVADVIPEEVNSNETDGI